MRQFRSLVKWSLRLIVLLFLAPALLHAAVWRAQGFPASWREADWSSAGILADPADEQEATIRIYSARTGGWKGAFATHSWLVMKRQGQDRYDRYDVVGWGNPVRKNSYPPDGRWYSNMPELVASIDGERAEQLIPELEKAIAGYRWSKRGDYTIWPGPNSNTFVATIVSGVPELASRMPSTAVGRDFPADGQWIGWTPSGGFRLSLGGYAGIVIGPGEGVEANFLGLVAGVDVQDLALKIPGFGRIDL